MPCGWEGNRRYDVALTTRQTLVVLHLRVQGLGEGDEHPPTLSWWSMVNFTLITFYNKMTIDYLAIKFIFF